MPDSFIPPTSVRNAAKRGLALRQKYGRGGLTTQQAGAQGIGSGVQRASDLANGKGITLDTIKRMVAFFSRHEGNKNTPPEKGNGMISWLLWGGDAGRAWAEGVLNNQESTKAKADAPNYRPAGPNLERCSTCRFFKAQQCTKYKFTAQASYTCDAWRPNVEKSQALRDLWGKESEEQKEVSAVATAVPAHGPGGLLSPLGLGKQKRKKRRAKTTTVKHLGSQHNQLMHGFRGGASLTPAKREQYEKAGVLDKFNKRHGGGGSSDGGKPSAKPSGGDSKPDKKPSVEAKPAAKPAETGKREYADYGSKPNAGDKALVATEERKKWVDGLSAKEKDAIGDYTSSNYREINDHLRNPKGKNAALDRKIETIDNALKKSSAPIDMTVHRVANNDALFDFFAKKAQKGGTWGDKAFLSTSLDKNAVGTPGGKNVSFKINVPKGSKGGYLNNDLSAFGNEKEWLFPRGTNFRIDTIRVGRNGRSAQVVMTVIP